jgi:hypothetical protein
MVAMAPSIEADDSDEQDKRNRDGDALFGVLSGAFGHAGIPACFCANPRPHV